MCLPATLISALFLLNIVNPMAAAFLTRFSVVNESGEHVSITPVGAIGSAGRRTTLPLSSASFLSIPSLRDRSFPLAAGGQRRFTYDWDDIQVSELLIVPGSGPVRELVLDPAPTQGQYRKPSTNYFVIPKLANLPIAKPSVHAVLDTPSGAKRWILLIMIIVGIAAPIGVVRARARLKATL